VFHEPSTRTIMSFQKAIMNLQGNVLLLDTKTSSIQKGETMHDTLKTLSCYSDAIVLRQPQSDLLRTFSVDVPLINAGDGSGEHPTQALLDMMTIFEKKQRTEHLNVVFVGDNEKSRTVHSLVRLLERFDTNRCIFFDPWTDKLEHRLAEADVVYVTRYQHERRSDKKMPFVTPINYAAMKHMKKDAIVMHPLPRRDELSPEVDDDPRCVYFEQVKNGVYMRMAILAKLVP